LIIQLELQFLETQEVLTVLKPCVMFFFVDHYISSTYKLRKYTQICTFVNQSDVLIKSVFQAWLVLVKYRVS